MTNGTVRCRSCREIFFPFSAQQLKPRLEASQNSIAGSSRSVRFLGSLEYRSIGLLNRPQPPECTYGLDGAPFGNVVEKSPSHSPSES
jgi:hypothetical protein